jgi:hypothetical protein
VQVYKFLQSAPGVSIALMATPTNVATHRPQKNRSAPRSSSRPSRPSACARTASKPSVLPTRTRAPPATPSHAGPRTAASISCSWALSLRITDPASRRRRSALPTRPGQLVNQIPAPNQDSCSSCIFFRPQEGIAGGICHRFPPRFAGGDTSPIAGSFRPCLISPGAANTTGTAARLDPGRPACRRLRSEQGRKFAFE